MQWVTHAERPDLGEVLGQWSDAWPAFVLHDQVAAQFQHRLDSDFPSDQHYLIDGGVLIGGIASVPLWWDGTSSGLPSGWDDALRRGVLGLGDGPVNTLCAIAAQVAPDRAGQGWSRHLINRLRAKAAERGYRAVIAPVRPTRKHRYPLIDMEHYVAWRREDGTHFDPWIRTHERCGGKIVGVARGSMVVTGTVREWEQWTGLALPGSGAHIVPGALVPVEVDVAADKGRYEEPNVWLVHTPDA